MYTRKAEPTRRNAPAEPSRARTLPAAPKRLQQQPAYAREANVPAVLAALRLYPVNVARHLTDAKGTEVQNPFATVSAQHVMGSAGEVVAAAFNAEAVTLGNRIFGPSTLPPSVLRHELVHAAQATGDGQSADVPLLETEARRLSAASLAGGMPVRPEWSAPAALPLRHPAVRTLLRAGAWLARRTTNTLSKHVARHGRRIAGRAVHSIFRDPDKVKSLVSAAVREATALARKHATKAAHEAIEEGGVAIRQQAGRVAGKVRTVVEKDFGRAIGTRGETILRVVLDQSGRVVTAFPVDRFLAIGLGAVAIDIFTEGTAEAAEEARARIEAYENRPTNWGEVAFELAIDIASLGLLSSSTANEGEDFLLAMDRLIEETAQAAIAEIEAEEGIELTDEQRQAIHDLAAVAIGAPMEFEDVEEEAQQPAQPRVIRSPDGSLLDTSTGQFSLGPGFKG